jgi:hypothetical protein
LTNPIIRAIQDILGTPTGDQHTLILNTRRRRATTHTIRTLTGGNANVGNMRNTKSTSGMSITITTTGSDAFDARRGYQ